MVDPESEDGQGAPENADPEQVAKDKMHLVRYFDGKRGKVDDSWFVFMSIFTRLSIIAYSYGVYRGWVAAKDLRLFGKFAGTLTMFG